jgi:hypothetical protein
MVVVVEVGVEVLLHVLEGLVPLGAALGAEVPIEQGARYRARRSRWIGAVGSAWCGA